MQWCMKYVLDRWATCLYRTSRHFNSNPQKRQNSMPNWRKLRSWRDRLKIRSSRSANFVKKKCVQKTCICVLTTATIQSTFILMTIFFTSTSVNQFPLCVLFLDDILGDKWHVFVFAFPKKSQLFWKGMWERVVYAYPAGWISFLSPSQQVSEQLGAFTSTSINHPLVLN